jgi:hypothetical protein
MKEYFKCETGTWKYLPNWLGNIKYNFKWIKWSWQRAFRGYADCDCWSVDGYLSVIIPDMLRHLKKYSHGIPTDKDGEQFTEQVWNDVLDKIIAGFEAAKRMTNDDNPQEYDIDFLIFEEGMKLFNEHYFSLWD